MSSWIDLSALAKVLGVGLLAGAGLPALFALGLRSLSPRATATAGRAGSPGQAEGQLAGPAGTAAAGLCFAVVLAGVAYGVYLVVAG